MWHDMPWRVLGCWLAAGIVLVGIAAGMPWQVTIVLMFAVVARTFHAMRADGRAWLARFENPANWVPSDAWLGYRAARATQDAPEQQPAPEAGPQAPAREVA